VSLNVKKSMRNKEVVGSSIRFTSLSHLFLEVRKRNGGWDNTGQPYGILVGVRRKGFWKILQKLICI
jgi:hypothetical protein